MNKKEYRLIKTLPTALVPAPVMVAFNKKNTKVVTVSGSTIRLINLETNTLITKLQDPDFSDGKAHSGEISSVEFSPDDYTINTYSKANDIKKFWNALTGHFISSYDFNTLRV